MSSVYQVHNLKTWPAHFRAVRAGIKTAELRKNDRGYADGDLLILNEFDPGCGDYTGEFVSATVTHVLPGPGFGLQEGHCLLSFSLAIRSRWAPAQLDHLRSITGVVRCKSREQGFSVWLFTDSHGERFWVAAKTYAEAMSHLLEKRPRTSFPDYVQVTDLDDDSFDYGDPDDGEEPIPCTLRELVMWSLSPDQSTPVLVAEDNF